MGVRTPTLMSGRIWVLAVSFVAVRHAMHPSDLPSFRVPMQTKTICDFTIYYDKWVTTFESEPYEPNNAMGKVHCLEECCQDPSCHGLALESDLNSQCYNYKKMPELDALGKGMPLAQHLTLEKEVQWSVFIKRVIPGSLPGPSIFSDRLLDAFAQRRVGHTEKASQEQLLDKKLAEQLHADFTCEWTVYYDVWFPTFDSGSYSHDEAFSGAQAHCLQKCCQDHSCVGLSIESDELAQCYKYSSVPDGLQTEVGQSLGDGNWLQEKPMKWSIMMKRTIAPTATKSPTSSVQTTHPVKRLEDASDSIIPHTKRIRATPPILENGISAYIDALEPENLVWKIEYVPVLFLFIVIIVLLGYFHNASLQIINLKGKGESECVPLNTCGGPKGKNIEKLLDMRT